MVRRRVALVLLLVSVAGCVSFQWDERESPRPSDVSVSIVNEHDTPYTVEVTAIPTGVDGIEVTYANGSDRVFDVESFDDLPDGALRNATSVSALDGAEFSRTLVVDADSGVGTTIEDVPPNATIVSVVRDGSQAETPRSVGAGRCSADATSRDLTITIRADGTLHTHLSCTHAALDGPEEPAEYGDVDQDAHDLLLDE